MTLAFHDLDFVVQKLRSSSEYFSWNIENTSKSKLFPHKSKLNLFEIFKHWIFLEIPKSSLKKFFCITKYLDSVLVKSISLHLISKLETDKNNDYRGLSWRTSDQLQFFEISSGRPVLNMDQPKGFLLNSWTKLTF